MDEPGSDFLARWRPHFEAAGLVFVVDFHGARAREQDELRALAHAVGGHALVVKRKRGPLLVRGTRLEAALAEVWRGPTLVVLAPASLGAIRDLAGHLSCARTLAVRLAWLDGTHHTLDSLRDLARKPLVDTPPPLAPAADDWPIRP